MHATDILTKRVRLSFQTHMVTCSSFPLISGKVIERNLCMAQNRIDSAIFDHCTYQLDRIRKKLALIERQGIPLNL